MSFTSSTFLRRAERDDLDTLLSWMSDPDFQYYLYGDAAQSQRQIREKIIQMLGRAPVGMTPPAIYLLIDSKEKGLLGMISLQNISWRNRSCSLDVYIGDKMRRNALITMSAVFRVLEYVFDELNLHRLGALIYSFNRVSWRIFELSGAKREIVLENHVVRDGKLYDAYGYGLLRSDFEEMRKQQGTRADDLSLENMIASLAEQLEKQS